MDSKHKWIARGMLMGMLIGSVLAMFLYIRTGNAESFAIAGIGLALGLALGATFDKTKKADSKGTKLIQHHDGA